MDIHEANVHDEGYPNLILHNILAQSLTPRINIGSRASFRRENAGVILQEIVLGSLSCDGVRGGAAAIVLGW